MLGYGVCRKIVFQLQTYKECCLHAMDEIGQISPITQLLLRICSFLVCRSLAWRQSLSSTTLTSPGRAAAARVSRYEEEETVPVPTSATRVETDKLERKSTPPPVLIEYIQILQKASLSPKSLKIRLVKLRSRRLMNMYAGASVHSPGCCHWRSRNKFSHET